MLEGVHLISPSWARCGNVRTNLWHCCKGYPYARPASSFLYANGRPYIFEDAAWTPELGQLVVTSPEGASQGYC